MHSTTTTTNTTTTIGPSAGDIDPCYQDGLKQPLGISGEGILYLYGPSCHSINSVKAALKQYTVCVVR